MAKKSIWDLTTNEMRNLDERTLATINKQMNVYNAGLSSRLNARQKSLATMFGQKKKMDQSPVSPLYAGNIGDVVKIIWPFYFQTEPTVILPDSVETTNITVTAEAAFIITHMTVNVHELVEILEVPATESVETLTFSSNALTDHVLDFNDSKIILGTDVALGIDLDATLQALIAYMNTTSPYQDLYVAAHTLGDSFITVTTIETGESANENNEYLYVYPNGDVAKIQSTGFIGGANLIPASTTLEYVNLNSEANEGLLDDLKLSIIDSQSTRDWHDEPVPVSHYGSARNPFYLRKPYMILQNQNLEVRWSNDGVKTYIPSFLFHGYRLRLKDGEGIMSLVQEN